MSDQRRGVPTELLDRHGGEPVTYEGHIFDRLALGRRWRGWRRYAGAQQPGNHTVWRRSIARPRCRSTASSAASAIGSCACGAHVPEAIPPAAAGTTIVSPGRRPEASITSLVSPRHARASCAGRRRASFRTSSDSPSRAPSTSNTSGSDRPSNHRLTAANGTAIASRLVGGIASTSRPAVRAPRRYSPPVEPWMVRERLLAGQV